MGWDNRLSCAIKQFQRVTKSNEHILRGKKTSRGANFKYLQSGHDHTKFMLNTLCVQCVQHYFFICCSTDRMSSWTDFGVFLYLNALFQLKLSFWTSSKLGMAQKYLIPNKIPHLKVHWSRSSVREEFSPSLGPIQKLCTFSFNMYCF